jgi:hypothetical protein
VGVSDLALLTCGLLEGDRVPPFPVSPSLFSFLDGALDTSPLPPDGWRDGDREVVATGLSEGIEVDSTAAGGLTGSGGRTVTGVDVRTIATGGLTGSAGRTVTGVELTSNATGGLTGSAGRAVADIAARGTGASDTGLGVDRARGETIKLNSALS